jgi:NADH:ubiquinone oxidoreductase subunit
MQETKDNSLFAELTPEESASVNGGHYYYSDRSYGRDNCGRRRRWVVYRRNCDGSYRRVVRYGYY